MQPTALKTALRITLTLLALLTANASPVSAQGSAEPASAGTPDLIALGDIVTGSIDAANSRDTYHFTAPADTVVFVDRRAASSAGQLNWKLCDAYGRVLAFHYTTLNDLGPVTLMGGEYTIVILSESGGESTYEFQLVDATPTIASLTLDTPVVGDLTTPGGTHEYTFTATAGQKVYFDVLAVASFGSVKFDLVDAGGRVIGNTTSSLFDSGPFQLAAGEHTLSIRSDNDLTSSYEFVLVDVSDDTAATSIGATVSGEISVSGQSDHYTFSATPGQRILFELLATTAQSSFNYRLVDSYGREILPRTTSLVTTGALALMGGDYTLSILPENGTTGTYEFEIAEITDGSGSLTIGAPVVGSIDEPYERDDYTFTASAGQAYYLDYNPPSAPGNLNYVITDADGFELLRTGSLADNGPFMLGNGAHTLAIVGESTATGPYDFTLIETSDVTSATSIGATETSSITLPGQRLHYTFTAIAGQIVTIDAITPASNNGLDWELRDSVGRLITETSSFSDIASLALAGGDYTLSIVPDNSFTTPIEFELIDEGTTTFTPTGTAINADTPVIGDISVAGEIDEYVLTVAATGRYYFDLIAATSGFRWIVLDPAGTQVFPIVNSTSSTLADRGPYDLAAGDYTVQIIPITTSTPSYEFAVVTVIDATAPLPLDTPIAGSIASPGGANTYELTLGGGTTVYFDLTTTAGSLNWELRDPFGVSVFGPLNATSTSSADQGPLVLGAGTYELIVDADNHQTPTFAFTVHSVTDQAGVAALNRLISDTFTVVGGTHVYDIAVPDGDRVYFDVQTGSSQIRASLVDPVGQPLFEQLNIASTVSGDRGPWVLQAGTYSLILDPTTQNLPSYTVQLQTGNPTVAPLPVDSVVATSLAGGAEILTYQLDVTGGPRSYYFDAVAAANQLIARLEDEYGNAVFDDQISNTSTDDKEFVLVDGSYELTFRTANGTSPSFEFEFAETSTTQEPLVLDADFSVPIDGPGDVREYTFTVGRGQQYRFDVVQGAFNLRWTLRDEVGATQGFWENQLTNTPFSRGPFSIAPGDYTLEIDTRYGTASTGVFRVTEGVALDPVVAEAGWELTDRVRFPFAQSAHRRETDGTLFVGSRGPIAGIYCVHSNGIPEFVDNSGPVSAVGITEAGDVFWSEDGLGRLFSLNTGNVWVNGFEPGDSDTAGMAFTPASYTGPLPIAGMGVVADPGLDGPDGLWLFSPSTPEGETLLVDDSSALEQAVDVAISSQHLYVADAGDGEFGTVWRLDPGDVLVDLGVTGLVPVGIAVDPTSDQLLVVDRLGQRVVRVDPDTGAFTDVVTGLSLDDNNGWASISISADGRELLVTSAHTVHEFTRCSVSGLDCNGNGLDDDCDLALNNSQDCNGNGIPDECDIANGTSIDLNFDGIPDECLPCSRVDLVFLVDTSGSMSGEGAALCLLMPEVIDSLLDAGIAVDAEIFGIGAVPGGNFGCLTGNARDIFGAGISSDCVSAGIEEDWGRATEVVSEFYPWSPGAVRVIVPVADEGPYCGDGIFADDLLSIDDAVAAAVANQVIVSPITGDGSSTAVLDLAEELASGTGGTAFASTTSTVEEISAGVQGLVISSCPCGVSINELSPAPNTALPVGTTVTVSGRVTAIDPDRPVVAVLIDGVSVESLDASGRFFHPHTIVEGLQTLQIEIVQSCDVSLTSLTLEGAAANDLDLIVYSDVTSSLTANYVNTTFNQTLSALQVDAEACNTSAFDIRGPIRMVIDGFTQPSVFTSNPDGQLDDGRFYFEFLSDGGILAPGECADAKSLVFNTPEMLPVLFDVTWLAADNRAPVIVSVPSVVVAADTNYTTTVEAIDLDGDPITYSFTVAPSGMTIDPNSGVIDWAPVAADIGGHEVRVTATDSFGASTTQQFVLSVEAQLPNHPPYFSSAPVTQVAVGAVYEALATAVDIDGDNLVFTKVDGPADLTVAPTGELNWNFTLPGNYSVHLRVEDGQGGQADQQYVLTVGTIATNPHAPQVFGSPSSVAVADQLYLYQPAANDADPGDVVEFSLAVAPLGMIVDTGNGRVTWIPTQSQLGLHPVTLVANDGNGGVSTQSWNLDVVGSAPNRAPIIQSVPTFYAETGVPYLYDVQAFDPDFDGVTYELVNPPAGMIIDPDTGFLEWTPSVVETVLVAIKAVDTAGAFGSQVYDLGVIPPNNAPTIDSTAVTEATVGGTYRYPVVATDPDGHPLGYSLDTSPVGMMVAASGQISWTPDASQVGTHDVTVRASDAFGGSDTQDFQITVIEDVVAPVVGIEFSHNPAPEGQPVLITVGAADDGLVVERTLTIDGVEATLDSFGQMIFDGDTAGSFELVATATDFAGNVGTKTETLSILAPDPELPVVELVSPQPDTVIGEVTDIVVSISDNVRQDLTWTVGYRPDETGDLTIFATGVGPVTDAVVAALDPTNLRNGAYWVQVLATDQTGNTGGIEFRVQVASELKLGQFSTSFVDLSIPVAGIPITITRQYKSLDTGVVGDFGPGWRLGFAGDVMDTAQEIDHPIQLVDDLNDQGFGNNTRVYVTLPNGRRVGFTFDPQPGSKPWVKTPSFLPDEGVTEKLEALPRFGVTALFFLGGYYAEFIFPYNPDVYIVTTQEGVKYTIHEREGLQKVEDIFGNTLDVTPEGVFSSTGVAVLTERDKLGRITKITEPEATPGATPGELHYGYDPANGNLISFTDQGDNTTLYHYEQPEVPHHLTEIEDPLGRPLVANVFDNDGRMIATCSELGDIDTLDGCLTFEYDNVALTQTLFDSNSNQSVYFFDDRGHLVVERRYTTPVDFIEFVRTYDEGGNLTSELDPEGYLYEFEYDGRNNMTSMTNPAGHVWTFEYDERDNLTLSCDPNGNCRTTVYDDKDRILSRTDPLGNVDTYTYLENGLLETHLDPVGNLRQYSYTSSGYLIGQIEPDGTTITYGRDNLGRLTELNDRLGRVATYTYSEDHHLLEEVWDTVPAEVMTYTYNAVGHLTSATNSDSSLSLEYWPTGLLKSVSSASVNGSEPWTVAYARDTTRGLVTGYDFNGNLTHVLDSFGGVTEYNYDTLDRVASIAQYAGDPTAIGGTALPVVPRGMTFEYDDGSLLLATRRFNDAALTVPAVDTLFGYDCGACPLRVTSIDHQRVSDGVSLHAMTFTRDERGAILESTDLEGTHAYAKDGEERLLGVTHSGAPGQVDESYTYDAVGNRLTSHLSASHELAYVTTPGSGLELLADDTFVYTYDDAGNLIVRDNVIDGTSTTYTYDHRNRLTEVHHFDNGGVELWSAEYRYDAINRRIYSDEAGETREYVYDRHNVLLTLDRGTVAKRRLLGHQVDEVHGYSEAGEGYWYLLDQKSTVRDIVDSAGVVQRHYVYDTFGNVVGGSGTLEDDLRLQSREFSDLTGLGYFRARYYDPTSGRFTSADPVMPHGYDFLSNNPTLFEDPMGEVSAIEFACEVVHSLGNVASAMKVTAPLANLYAEIVLAVVTLTPPPGGGGAAARRYRDAMIKATLEEIRDEAIKKALGPMGACAFTAAGLVSGGGGGGGPGGGPAGGTP